MMMKEAKPGELCKYQRVTGAGQHEYKIVLVYERTKMKNSALMISREYCWKRR